jgi:GT2 family glycosyltransferase
MKDISMKVTLRVNTHEDISILNRFLSDPRLIVIFNLEQHGYVRNHNLNFDLEKSDYFVVLNPDIRLICNKIDLLTRHFSSADVGVVAPAVVSSDHSLEDSIRRFPSVAALIKRYAFKLDVGLERRALLGSKVDWCAGMFLWFSLQSHFDLLRVLILNISCI